MKIHWSRGALQQRSLQLRMILNKVAVRQNPLGLSPL
jgi:hypothetical protein